MTLQHSYKCSEREERNAKARHVDHELAERDEVNDWLRMNLIRFTDSWRHLCPWVAHLPSPYARNIGLNAEYVNG